MTKDITTDCFPIYSDSRILSTRVAESLVRYGHTRIADSGVGNSSCPQASTTTMRLQHSELELGTCLGRGGFSIVYDVVAIRSESSPERSSSSKKVVVKVLGQEVAKNPRMFAACAADLVKEGLILSSLSHRNIIKATALGWDDIVAYRNGRHDAFFIVLERLEHTLGDRIKSWQSAKKKRFVFFPSSKKTNSRRRRENDKAETLKSKADIILQLADALEYIHANRMIHRDIKPENIGFDGNDVLKVFDFDVARLLPDDSDHHHTDGMFQLTKHVGSPRYMSPECALGKEYNAKTDVYAFGLICHEILTLKQPYAELQEGDHDKAVFHGRARPAIPSSWTKGMKAIVESCWAVNVSVRPTMAEAHKCLEEELPIYMLQKLQQKSNKSSNTWPLGRAKTLPQQ